MIAGFENGSVHVIHIYINVDHMNSDLSRIQSIRPHKSAVILFKWEPTHENVLVSMSMDQNLFLYQVSPEKEDFQLEPRAFIPIDVNVSDLMFAQHTNQTVSIFYFRIESFVFAYRVASVIMAKNPYTLLGIQDNYHLFVAAEDMVLMKIMLPKNIVAVDDTFCMSNNLNTIETHHLTLDGEIAQIESFKETVLWILSSNGNIYEYDLISKQCKTLVTENSDEIASFILWYARQQTLVLSHRLLIKILISVISYSQKTYAVVGCMDGSLSIYSLSTENETMLEHIFSSDILHKFDMHHPTFRFDPHTSNLFVHNSEEAIICFHLNTCSPEPRSANVCKIDRPAMVKHVDKYDIEDELTLEEQKQIEAENRRLDEAEANKSKLSTTCSELRQDWQTIKKMNSELPETSKIDSIDFVIDQRITDEIQRTMEIDLSAIQNELRWIINGVQRRCETIQEAFLYNLDHWTFAISGFK